MLGIGLAFSEKKIIPQNLEQTEILIHSVEIPAVSQNGKRSEFRLSHSEEDKTVWNFVPKHFVEEKNTWNFLI
jgi:hypothetical protein